MAVVTKSTEQYGYSILALFGVDSFMVSTAKNLGVEIQHSSGTFKIVKGDTVYGTVTLKGSSITLAKDGNLGPASKQAIKFNFESALSKALKSIAGTSAPVNKEAEPINLSGSGKLKVAPLKSSPVPLSTSPCHLAEAGAIYQPVFGTSNGSVYYVVARFNGLNIAARIKPSTLSLRAEGPDLGSYKAELTSVGFSVKDDYASVHFDINAADKALMRKTFGAVVGVLGVADLIEAAEILKVKGA